MKRLVLSRSRAIPALVLLFVSSTFLTSPAAAKAPKIKDLADTVSANPILTKFAAVIQASDLGTFLSSRGPFTLFVPTDAAFDKLPPGTLDALLQPQNKVRLQDILLFHVVNGKKLTAKDQLLLKSTLSCQGAPLLFRTTRSGVQLVMKAKIVHSDIRCQNGLIHEIDTVSMPPESALPPLAAPPSPLPATNAPPAVTNAPTFDTNNAPVPQKAPVDTNNVPVAPNAPGA
jgi:uncharacterized surface protein with fasciclin (FAS1) repeats